MEESCGKPVATRAGPEPWRQMREGMLQASVGVRVGRLSSREKGSRTRRRGCPPKAKAMAAVSLAPDAAGSREAPGRVDAWTAEVDLTLDADKRRIVAPPGLQAGRCRPNQGADTIIPAAPMASAVRRAIAGGRS